MICRKNNRSHDALQQLLDRKMRTMSSCWKTMQPPRRSPPCSVAAMGGMEDTLSPAAAGVSDPVHQNPTLCPSTNNGDNKEGQEGHAETKVVNMRVFSQNPGPKGLKVIVARFPIAPSLDHRGIPAAAGWILFCIGTDQIRPEVQN